MDVKHLPLQLTLHLLRLWIQLTDFILLLIGVQLFYSVVLVCTANWLSYTYTCVLAAQSCLSLCNSMTIALQAPLSMQFSRQEYWNGLPFLEIPHETFNTTSIWFTFLVTMSLKMCIFWKIFFNVDHFQSLYWIHYNIASVVCFLFLVTRHVGS